MKELNVYGKQLEQDAATDLEEVKKQKDALKVQEGTLAQQQADLEKQQKELGEA